MCSIRNNLPQIKCGAHIINLDEYELIETHWIVLYVNAKNVTYLDSFGVKDISIKLNTKLNSNNLDNLLEIKIL